jgi:hypothetical protein
MKDADLSSAGLVLHGDRKLAPISALLTDIDAAEPGTGGFSDLIGDQVKLQPMRGRLGSVSLTSRADPDEAGT